MNKIDAIVQARRGSTRLPNKILQPIVNRPLLGHVIDRLKECPLVDRIIIATTTSKDDDDVERFCSEEKVLCFRGSSERVLKRFLDACNQFRCDHFLRVCSDNPFIDPILLSKQIELFSIEYDYCSYYTQFNEPGLLKPVGFFAECVTTNALLKSAEIGGGDPRIQEHVTFLILSKPKLFKIKKLIMPNYINPELRFTVDYLEDQMICAEIIKNVKKLNSINIMKYVNSNTIIMEKIKQQALVFPKTYSSVSIKD